VLTALIVDGGQTRERAYRMVQALAMRARDGGEGFEQLVRHDPEVTAALDSATIDRCFDVAAYLEHIDETYRRLGLSTTADAAPAPTASAQPQLAVEAGIAGGRV
jgi:adenylosuccinate lyase